MLRNVAEPLDAGGLEADVGVKAAGDGLVDDGLPLLLQQRDKPPLGGDVPPDAPVNVVQVPHDGALLGEGWEGQPQILELATVDVHDGDAPPQEGFLSLSGWAVQGIACKLGFHWNCRPEYDHVPTTEDLSVQ